MLAFGGVVGTAHSLALGNFLFDVKEKDVVIKKVVSVDVKIQESDPPTLVVTAVGQVPTGGFSGVKLTRVTYIMPPKDGIQEYTFTAVPPDGPATQALSKVTGVDRWTGYNTAAPWLKGVRVGGVTKLLK